MAYPLEEDKDEDCLPRPHGIPHPADEYAFSNGEYHEADKTRNPALSRFSRKEPFTPSPLSIVTSGLDPIGDLTGPGPDTPALSPVFASETPAFQTNLDLQR